MKYTNEEISQKLVQEWNYTSAQASRVTEKLMNMDPALVDAFANWMDTGFLPDYPVIAGFHPLSAWKTYQQKPPAVFLLLDWIRREPEQAFQALQEDYGRTTPIE